MGTVLRALPWRWLPTLARLLTRGERHLSLARRRRATVTWALVFGGGEGTPGGPASLDLAAAAAWLDALASVHGRNPWRDAARRSLGTLPPGPLYLWPSLGGSRLLTSDPVWRRRRGMPLDTLPRRAADAACIEFLGRTSLVDVARVRTSLARRRPLHVLALLPREDGLPEAWCSPELGQGAPADEAARVLQRAFDVVALLARARPDLLDGSVARWRLRPARELAGHPPWSRWAPWLARGARAARAR